MQFRKRRRCIFLGPPHAEGSRRATIQAAASPNCACLRRVHAPSSLHPPAPGCAAEVAAGTWTAPATLRIPLHSLAPRPGGGVAARSHPTAGDPTRCFTLARWLSPCNHHAYLPYQCLSSAMQHFSFSFGFSIMLSPFSPSFCVTYAKLWPACIQPLANKRPFSLFAPCPWVLDDFLGLLLAMFKRGISYGAGRSTSCTVTSTC